VQGNQFSFNVKAQQGSDTFGILQSPFMFEKAKTTAFEVKLLVEDNVLSYKDVMSLIIYGK